MTDVVQVNDSIATVKPLVPRHSGGGPVSDDGAVSCSCLPGNPVQCYHFADYLRS